MQMQLVRLDSSDMSQGWQHVQRTHLSTATAAGGAHDAVILVHPVASEQQPCVVSEVQGKPCHNCPRGQPGCSFDEVEAAELLAGRFGDCCSEDEDGHHHEHEHHQQWQQPATGSSSTHQHRHLGNSSTCAESELSYYGLVVQCRDPEDSLQGCYLLKTMQSKQHHGSSSGCCCTHYSLNRVCKGPSLQQQFQEAWLV